MASSRRRNDRNGRKFSGFRPPQAATAPGGSEWIWGRHAVQAALANPRRPSFGRLLLAPGKTLDPAPQGAGREVRAEEMDNHEIARLLPQGAVHQGYALLAEPLEPVELEEIAEPAQGVILMLDQVTDPQNIGAILRTAAAFGARGVILQDRRAPPLSGALAKAAAGAADVTPVVRAVNLSRALERLTDLGWRSVGLAGESENRLEAVLDGGPTVLVLGSEGDGMRRLVAEHCDVVARIGLAGGFESLNVASAAAVALYEASRLARHGSGTP